MKIAQLEVTNFRCHQEITLSLESEQVMIYGNNGIGKTSLLEAIYLGLSSRSFRTTDVYDVTRYNSLFTKIKILTDQQVEIKHLLSDRKRSIMVGNVLVARTSDFIKKYPVLCFSQKDYKFFFDTPSFRRNYFDVEIIKQKPSFQKTLYTYQQLLKQRNALLKKMKVDDDPTFIKVINAKLSEVGITIINERNDFINQINNSLKNLELYKKALPPFLLSYKVNTNPDKLLYELNHHYQKDIISQQTNYGPHRDDITVNLSQQNVASIFSTGEQKLSIYIIKLAIHHILTTIYKESPVFLIDDVFAELDDHNINLIMHHLPSKAQIIMTTTINKEYDNFTFIDLNKILKPIKGVN